VLTPFFFFISGSESFSGSDSVSGTLSGTFCAGLVPFLGVVGLGVRGLWLIFSTMVFPWQSIIFSVTKLDSSLTGIFRPKAGETEGEEVGDGDCEFLGTLRSGEGDQVGVGDFEPCLVMTMVVSSLRLIVSASSLGFLGLS